MAKHRNRRNTCCGVSDCANRPEADVEPFTRALRLYPRDPLHGYAELGLAIAHRDLGQAVEALAWARRAMLTLPRVAGGYGAAPNDHVDLDRLNEAHEMIQQLRDVGPHRRSLRPATQPGRPDSGIVDGRPAAGRPAD